MSLAFYMDVHIPAAVTRGLRLRDVDVLTAQEDAHQQADDSTLLDRASELGRILVSQDDDLLAEAMMRQRHGKPFAGVIYGHQLEVTIGRMVNDLDLISKAGTREDLAGRVEYLPF
jgi:predicted nuclease of predicted toxin-antitoxin system